MDMDQDFIAIIGLGIAILALMWNTRSETIRRFTEMKQDSDIRFAEMKQDMTARFDALERKTDATMDVMHGLAERTSPH